MLPASRRKRPSCPAVLSSLRSLLSFILRLFNGQMIATRGTPCLVAYDYDDNRMIAKATTRYINADFETLAVQRQSAPS